jgi:predicted NAD/FAD-binding protein
MRVAIIGAGVAGMTAAYRLHREHEVTVFEASDHFGGHTYTRDVELHGRPYAVDMGFIVFNDWTYPRFIALLNELGVASQPSNMSFSVSCERTGLEYNGTSLNALFAQRRNLVNPTFLGMIADILRFNRQARSVLTDDRYATTTLGQYLHEHRFSRAFIDYYVVPMGRAIWSATEEAMLNCPVRFFVDFFDRHGFLNVNNRPLWRAIRGGSREYAKKLTAPYKQRLKVRTPVAGVQRQADSVIVRTAKGDVERFDYVVFACHSDQALKLLDPPTPLECEILSAFPYQENDTVLHTDTRMLPRTPLARAAWNYHGLARGHERVAVTYDMNILQTITAPEVFMVTLNRTAEIDPRKILHRVTFDHPVYTPGAVAAQSRRTEISGHNRTFYCGAYWRYGFHEDGCVSGEWAVDDLRRVIASREHASRPAMTAAVRA